MGSVRRATLPVAAVLLLLLSLASAQQFGYSSFLNRPRLVMDGDASVQFSDLALTKGEGSASRGAAFFDSGFDLSLGFSTTFTLSASKVKTNLVDSEKDRSVAKFAIKSNSPFGKELFSVVFDLHASKVWVSYPKVHMDHANASLMPINWWNTLQPGALGGRLVKIDLDSKRLIVSIENGSSSSKTSLDVLINVEVPAMPTGKYKVGFEGVECSKHPVRFVIGSWLFGSFKNMNQCAADDFSLANGCVVDDSKAESICATVADCRSCAQQVYNCVWCKSKSHSGSSCVVGETSFLHAECQSDSYVVEAVGCENMATYAWPYLVLFLIVAILSLFVVYFSSKRPLFGMTLIVAGTTGAVVGMLLSWLVSVSLVEISLSPMVAIMYATFFFVETAVMAARLCSRKRQHKSPALFGMCVMSFVSGVATLLLDREFVKFLPNWTRVILYAALAAALNFCIVFALADVASLLHGLYVKRRYGKELPESELDVVLDRAFADAPPRPRTVSAKKTDRELRDTFRTNLLTICSLLSGAFFGLAFGVLRVEDESQYRLLVALRHETLFTFPMGGLIGCVTGVASQYVALKRRSVKKLPDTELGGGGRPYVPPAGQFDDGL